MTGDAVLSGPAGAQQALDLARLEAAVQALTERFVALRDENAKLAREVAARDGRIEELEAETRRMQQTRRDVARRIDQLIQQIDQLEGRFPARSE